jgi:glyoxylase-like metal-dependent hydrolase (beta-lactamase superfamily II)
MYGSINITSDRALRIHTYTAPDDGWGVNSHIIELATQTIVIDAQYTLVYGRDVADYADALGKPISRLYVTHYHPDHLLGAAAFPAPIRALAEVKDKIDAVGDRVAREDHEKFPETIPTHAEKPSLIVTPGSEIIDGVRFEFLQLRHGALSISSLRNNSPRPWRPGRTRTLRPDEGLPDDCTSDARRVA